jgi:hypothetical protein
MIMVQRGQEINLRVLFGQVGYLVLPVEALFMQHAMVYYTGQQITV